MTMPYLSAVVFDIVRVLGVSALGFMVTIMTAEAYNSAVLFKEHLLRVAQFYRAADDAARAADAMDFSKEYEREFVKDIARIGARDSRGRIPKPHDDYSPERFRKRMLLESAEERLILVKLWRGYGVDAKNKLRWLGMTKDEVENFLVNAIGALLEFEDNELAENEVIEMGIEAMLHFTGALKRIILYSENITKRRLAFKVLRELLLLAKIQNIRFGINGFEQIGDEYQLHDLQETVLDILSAAVVKAAKLGEDVPSELLVDIGTEALTQDLSSAELAKVDRLLNGVELFDRIFNKPGRTDAKEVEGEIKRIWKEVTEFLPKNNKKLRSDLEKLATWIAETDREICKIMTGEEGTS